MDFLFFFLCTNRFLTDVFIFSTYKLQFLKNSYVVFCEQEWALKQGQVIFLKQIEAIAPSPSLCQAWVWLSLSFVILAYPSPSFFSGCPVIAQWFGFFLKAECNVSVDLSEADLDLSWNTLWVVPCKKKWWRIKMLEADGNGLLFVFCCRTLAWLASSEVVCLVPSGVLWWQQWRGLYMNRWWKKWAWNLDWLALELTSLTPSPACCDQLALGSSQFHGGISLAQLGGRKPFWDRGLGL